MAKLDEVLVDIQRINVKPGDVLHVKVGIEDVGGFPWIPGPEEIESVKRELEAHLPDGVTAYVTHQGVDIDTIVSPENG
jgi:NADPH:quinone reductase-like Zn-dependent oxidoreductase